MRKEEERKKALDARLRFEQERMEQERLEQEERERRYREREEQIEEHRHGWGRVGCGYGMAARVVGGAGWAHGCPSQGGVGAGTGRSRCPVPLLFPRCRRKQQSMEAEEARQRLKEQSIFVSAMAGLGPGSEPGLPLALPPGKGFPQLPAWGWEVMLCLFAGGPARGGRQAAVQEIGVGGGGECGDGHARCWSSLPIQLDGNAAVGCMEGGPTPPHHWGGGAQPLSSPQEAAAIIAQRPDNPRDFFKQQERVASGSSDAVSPGSHRTGEGLWGAVGTGVGTERPGHR